jgi:hypothetical protein
MPLPGSIGDRAAEAKANAARLIGDLVRGIEAEPESANERPPAKLERLRNHFPGRHSQPPSRQEMIAKARVQVNGKVVTELGSKATPADHIRVDGKLLQGAERLRYFMLNKPRAM